MNYQKRKKNELLVLLREKDQEIDRLNVLVSQELEILKALSSNIDQASIEVNDIVEASINNFYNKFVINKIDEKKPIYREIQLAFFTMKSRISTALKPIYPQNERIELPNLKI